MFGTIAAESQRLINETYSTFVQGFMPSLNRADYDVLEGITPAIVVDQERMGANARSTVGTVTDANAMLRVLFSRLGTPYIGPPTAFSFNVPTRKASGVMSTEKAGGKVEKNVVRQAIYLGGMCAECEGRGTTSDLDLTEIIDESKSLVEGAILVPGYTADGWMVAPYKVVVPPDVPIKDLTEAQRNDLLYGDTRKVKVEKINITYEGLIPKIRKSMFSKDVDSLQPHIRAFVERAAVFADCPNCDGTRLNESARSSTIKGINIADVCAMQINDAAEWIRSIDDRGVAPLVANLLHLFDSFVEIGLGYLSLDRPVGQPVGRRGPAHQDDPPPGLRADRRHLRLRRAHRRPAPARHPADEQAAAEPAGQGQHGAGRRAQARDDRDRRPRRRPRSGGRYGGRLGVLRGHRQGAAGEWHHDRSPPRPPGPPQGSRAVRRRGPIEIRGANTHNLQDVDVDVPLGVLCVVTGVAGSGKSSLIHGSLARGGGAKDAGVVVVDQSAIKGSRRSNPATYTGLLEPIRKAFAKANGVKPALFSSNSEGACESCNGNGMIYTELELHGDRRDRVRGLRRQAVPGGGARAEVRRAQHRRGARPAGGGGARVLRGRVTPRLRQRRRSSARLEDVGLGYVKLGQPLNTLSGGERQRLKLATHLSDKGGVYVLDEPTSGLHLADVDNLLGLLDRLVDSGKSVIVIEHHQAVMAHADWIIDLGPGAGHDGGKVVFEGTPADLIAARSTLTGEHLAEYVAG